MTPKDHEDIQKYFGERLDALTPESYKKQLKQLRAKYHPDNFEKFEDETVKEMATERFQRIEELSALVDAHFNGGTLAPKGASQGTDDPLFSDLAIFAANKLKVELITTDKDLKYHLFGTRYRWLTYGDTYKIPNTTGTLVIDGNHQGTRIGFNESIKIYLTFGEQSSVGDIADWLFAKLEGQNTKLLIEREATPITSEAIQQALRKASFLRLETGAE